MKLYDVLQLYQRRSPAFIAAGRRQRFRPVMLSTVINQFRFSRQTTVYSGGRLGFVFYVLATSDDVAASGLKQALQRRLQRKPRKGKNNAGT